MDFTPFVRKCSVKTHFKRSVFQQLIFLFATVSISGMPRLGYTFTRAFVVAGFFEGLFLFECTAFICWQAGPFEKMDIRSRP